MLMKGAQNGTAASAKSCRTKRSEAKPPPEPQRLDCPGAWNGQELLPCRRTGDYARAGNAACPTCFGSGTVTPACARALGERMRRDCARR